MSDFSLPQDTVDRWLAGQYRALVDDLIAACDLEAGLRAAMIPARATDLITDLRDVLDVETGLGAIVPPAVTNDPEPWQGKEAPSLPGSVAVALRRGSAARVFLSYAGADRALAGELSRRLATDGHEVALDQSAGITGGRGWEQRLSERLRWADAMICVVTSAYVASQWCMAEVGFARSQRSWLLPVWAEPGVDNPPLRSIIAQGIDQVPDSVGAALATLTGHTNTVTSVAFSPDGQTLATASADNTARLWETNIDRIAARICSITPTITRTEWAQYLPDLPYRPPCR